MTWSMSRNAAMNMPRPPPHAFHGYAGTWAQTADVTGSSSMYQPSWDQYIPQPDMGASSWQKCKQCWMAATREDGLRLWYLEFRRNPSTLFCSAFILCSKLSWSHSRDRGSEPPLQQHRTINARDPDHPQHAHRQHHAAAWAMHNLPLSSTWCRRNKKIGWRTWRR